MKKFTLNLSGRKHEIWAGENILGQLATFSRLKKASKIFIFSDSRLKFQARKLEKELSKEFQKKQLTADIQVRLIFLEVTEKLKDFHTLYPFYGQLLKAGADRHSIIFALGGGVIGDAVGFIAGTYMRGISWVGIPSTLLAQVDSSLGGKTGINHERGKNLIGIVHQPSLVVCELSFLRSLQPRDLISGLGEMIKYGLIFDPALFSRLEKNWKSIVGIASKPGDLSSLQWLGQDIHTCLKWKASVVLQDERDEKGIREVLNFGHTFGHALEAESRYGYFRHGEAIIYGMRVACLLSVKRGHLNSKVQTEIDRFLAAIPVPSLPKGVPAMRYVKRIQADKKARNRKVRFVLLKKMGATVLDRAVTDQELVESILEITGKGQ
jgi:3-dehydroquinate synthase